MLNIFVSKKHYKAVLNLAGDLFESSRQPVQVKPKASFLFFASRTPLDWIHYMGLRARYE